MYLSQGFVFGITVRAFSSTPVVLYQRISVIFCVRNCGLSTPAFLCLCACACDLPCWYTPHPLPRPLSCNPAFDRHSHTHPHGLHGTLELLRSTHTPPTAPGELIYIYIYIYIKKFFTFEWPSSRGHNADMLYAHFLLGTSSNLSSSANLECVC